MAKKSVSNFVKIQFSLLLLLSVQACSLVPDWLGDAKKDSGIKGKRVSVLSLEGSLVPDAALSEIKISLPNAESNQNWYKSDGHSGNIPSNIAFASEVSHTKKISTGAGETDSQHLNASPIIAEGKVFTISADSVISAYDVANIKKRLWKTKLRFGDKKEKFSSAAGITYHDGYIYTATGYNVVAAIDAKSGDIKWTRSIDGIARSAPAASGNIVFVNTLDNKLYALDKKDGVILWTHSGSMGDMSMFTSGSPLVYEGLVLVPYSSGEVYTLNANDGSEVWSDVFARRSISSANILSDIDAPPVASGGKVFVISNDGVLAASDIRTGKRLWEQEISGRQSPWIAGDFMYVLSNRNELLCIHLQSGGIKWVRQLITYKKADSKDNPIKWSGPVLAGGNLWVVSSHGKLMALSPRDGSEVYSRKVSEDIYIAPVVANGYMYLYSDDAELIELSSRGNK